MNRRLILAGVLGGLAMFGWASIAHLALPLGEAGVRTVDAEEQLVTALRTTIPEHGLYMFPKMAPGMTQDQYQAKITSAPSGLMVYFPSRQFSFGKLLVVEFGTELVESLIAVWLLSRARWAGFGATMGFYALLGLVAAMATNVSYWNWYGFPVTYTVAYMFTGWVSFLAAGLVAAKMKIGAEG